MYPAYVGHFAQKYKSFLLTTVGSQLTTVCMNAPRKTHLVPTLPAKQLTALLRQPPAKEEVSHAYDKLRQRYILRQVVEHFNIREDEPAPLYGKTLLDVGSGESTIAEFLALSGADITAIDPNPAALSKAEESAKAFGAPVTFLNIKVEAMVSANQQFNVILALDVAEDTADLPRFVWALKQLLAPGGLIIFSAITRSPMAWLTHILLSEKIYQRTPQGKRHWQRFYTPGQLRVAAAAHGLVMGPVQPLRFSVASKRWVLSNRTGSRYLTTLTFKA
jgi:2-polyprenyl-6-hydroxyphenyl methylase/3-demethylubiquinone-9 3-methyltransferase